MVHTDWLHLLTDSDHRFDGESHSEFLTVSLISVGSYLRKAVIINSDLFRTFFWIGSRVTLQKLISFSPSFSALYPINSLPFHLRPTSLSFRAIHKSGNFQTWLSYPSHLGRFYYANLTKQRRRSRRRETLFNWLVNILSRNGSTRRIRAAGGSRTNVKERWWKNWTPKIERAGWKKGMKKSLISANNNVVSRKPSATVFSRCSRREKYSRGVVYQKLESNFLQGIVCLTTSSCSSP